MDTYRKSLGSDRCVNYITNEIASFVNGAITNKWFYAIWETTQTFPSAYVILFWDSTAPMSPPADTSNIQLYLETSPMPAFNWGNTIGVIWTWAYYKHYKTINLGATSIQSWCIEKDSYRIRIKNYDPSLPTVIPTKWIRINAWLSTDRSNPNDKSMILDKYRYFSTTLDNPPWDGDFRTAADFAEQTWFMILESCTNPASPLCREEHKITFDTRTTRVSSHECNQYKATPNENECENWKE